MGLMYFPDEIDREKRRNKKRRKTNWIKVAYNWCFEESLIKAWIIVLILMLLNLILWFFF